MSRPLLSSAQRWGQKLVSAGVVSSVIAPVSSFVVGRTHQPQATARFLSTEHHPPAAVNIRHINKAQMGELLQDYEGDNAQNLVVMDVRTEPEVYQTGPLSESIHTLPVQVILQQKVFELEAEDFEALCGFSKPDPDQTLVFTCAAGVRSVYACHMAAQAGYGNLINYTGGSNEWFLN